MNPDSTTLSDLQAILGSSGGDKTPSLIDTDAIVKAMMPITIILTVLSIIITLLYIFSLIQRIRVNKAILETRDLLKEMNARDKTEIAQPEAPATPQQSSPTE